MIVSLYNRLIVVIHLFDWKGSSEFQIQIQILVLHLKDKLVLRTLVKIYTQFWQTNKKQESCKTLDYRFNPNPNPMFSLILAFHNIKIIILK